MFDFFSSWYLWCNLYYTKHTAHFSSSIHVALLWLIEMIFKEFKRNFVSLRAAVDWNFFSNFPIAVILQKKISSINLDQNKFCRISSERWDHRHSLWPHKLLQSLSREAKNFQKKREMALKIGKMKRNLFLSWPRDGRLLKIQEFDKNSKFWKL